MTDGDIDAQRSALDAEESELRTRLRALEELVHSRLLPDRRSNATAIDRAEREIRSVVLRLVEMERDRIELNIAASS